jgi:hypothetical protein
MAEKHPLEDLLLHHGTCVDHPHPEWWVGSNAYGLAVEQNRAKKLCRECPVLSECRQVVEFLEGAGSVNHYYKNYAGVWAGEAPHERHARRQGHRGAA